MGSSQSIRATHFQRPSKETRRVEPEPAEKCEENHISITNKMVERLVEDATIAGGAAAAAKTHLTPRDDYRDKIYMEKLKCMDISHSERTGMTIEDLKAMATRIERRTSNMVSIDGVCVDCKNKVIDCYKENEPVSGTVKCWDTVDEFSKCVSDAAATRLRARTQKEARDHARRTRHVAHAREHALKDLASTSLVD